MPTAIILCISYFYIGTVVCAAPLLFLGDFRKVEIPPRVKLSRKRGMFTRCYGVVQPGFSFLTANNSKTLAACLEFQPVV